MGGNLEARENVDMKAGGERKSFVFKGKRKGETTDQAWQMRDCHLERSGYPNRVRKRAARTKEREEPNHFSVSY